MANALLFAKKWSVSAYFNLICEKDLIFFNEILNGMSLFVIIMLVATKFKKN